MFRVTSFASCSLTGSLRARVGIRRAQGRPVNLSQVLQQSKVGAEFSCSPSGSYRMTSSPLHLGPSGPSVATMTWPPGLTACAT